MIKKWEFNITTFKNHTFKSIPKKQLIIDITGYKICSKLRSKKLRY